MGWLKFIIFVTLSVVKGEEETCLTAEEDPYVYFATKTSYNFINTGLPNTRLQDIPGCRPEAFWLLLRHGAHHPEADEIKNLTQLVDFKKNVIQNYDSGSFRNFNQRICSADIDILKRWYWNPQNNITFAGKLTSEGYMTTQRIAQAWRQKYIDLLTSNRHDYLFKFLDDQRSTNSFLAFAEGLFGQMADNLDIPRVHNETLLKPYNNCQAWIREVEDNHETLAQVHIFESKQEFKDMISNISQRLGFSYSVDRDTVDRMYEMCRYDKAWDVAHISPWCAAFTKEDLKRLEYAEDLKTYYREGYGSNITKKLGCTLVSDMMKFFSNRVNNPNLPIQPRVSIQFVDNPMYLMTLATLGAHHDLAPLTGDNYHSPQTGNRKWVTSLMDPFNANLAAVLYRCSHPDPKQQFKVLFLENEHQMYLDDCRVGLCDWSTLEARYRDVTNNCDLKFCNSGNSVSGYVGLTIALAAFVMGIIGL